VTLRVKASEQHSDKPQGDFVSGGLLPPGRWAAERQHPLAAVRGGGAAFGGTVLVLFAIFYFATHGPKS
jgi:hypothetical protein